MISFSYKGEPVGKARPKFSKWGAYTPKKTVDYENAVRQAFVDSGEVGYGGDEELVMEIVFNFSVPKSYTKKKRNSCLSGETGHTKKPDIDNCIKSVLDAIQGDSGAFQDDSQVTQIYAYKKYAEEPSVEVKIWEKNTKKE